MFLDLIRLIQDNFFSHRHLISEVIYLGVGLHVIDVAVRAEGSMPFHINYGTLTIEVIEYESGVDLGDLKPVNVTAIN